jgi:TolB-like protein/Tfp pilus assembly protein PilF
MAEYRRTSAEFLGSSRIAFGEYQFDRDAGQLWRGGEEIKLAPRASALLAALAERSTQVVTKKELIDRLWDGRAVGDDALTSCVLELRRALGDDPRNPRFVETRHRLGYRLLLPVAPAAMASPAAGKLLPVPLSDKASIAVLPFENLSADPEQEYFADGIVEEIITGLSRSKQLLVIARNSSFAYKGKSPDIRQVGRELGVRYVLEGSVRKSGNRVRITGQLIEAESRMHIWADRFDGSLEDIFDLQDRVAGGVIGGISTPVFQEEVARAKRKVGNLQAYDYWLRSWAALRLLTAEGSTDALALAREAIALDPDFALGHAAVAFNLHHRWVFGWGVDRAAECEEAGRAARRALELDSSDPRVLVWCGQTLVMTLGRLQEGAALLDEAVRIDPNLAWGLTYRASARIALGDLEKAIADLERAMRLSPLDPQRFYMLTLLARAHTLGGRYDTAVPLAAASLRLRSNFPASLLDSTVAHALAGDLVSARQSLAAFQKIFPDARIANYRRVATNLSAAGIETYVEGLRLAGLPE